MNHQQYYGNFNLQFYGELVASYEVSSLKCTPFLYF